MRQIISVFAIASAALMASCNNSEMKEHRAALQAQQVQLEAMKMDLVRQRTIDSMNAVAKVEADAKKSNATTVVRYSAPRRSRSSSSDRAYTSASSNYSGAGYSQPTTVAQPAVYQPAPVVQQEPQRRGWSAKAKGAVIGAGVGAASGAIINKRNRGAGAIIGAVGGAAAGTGIGAIIDRKNDR